MKVTDLLDNGYKRIDGSMLDVLKRSADEVYQKRIKDGDMTKYFITCYVYNNNSFEFEVYTYLEDVAVKLLFYCIRDKSLQEIEELIDKHFDNSGYKYYEE